MVVNGQYEITSITDRSSVNSAVNRTERPAAPSRVAGDNGFESNLKPSTYHAEMVEKTPGSSSQGSGGQEYQSNIYTREQVTRPRTAGLNSGNTRQSGAGNQASNHTGQTAAKDDNAARMQSGRQVEQLKQAEREVIAHEQAHLSAGGQYAGTPTYSYTQGPDGKRYITGGEVSINAPAGKDAEETARIMEQVKRAALAPANPSSQDIKVASRASASEQAALREQAIDQSLQQSQALRQEIQSSLKSRQDDSDAYQASMTKVEDITDRQNNLRLNRQAQLAQNGVRTEKRNLDAAAVEQEAIQQDYQRKIMEYQRIMQQVNNLKSSVNPAARAVNMVA